MNLDPTATEPQQPKLELSVQAFVGTEQQIYTLMVKATTFRITPFIVQCLVERNSLFV